MVRKSACLLLMVCGSAFAADNELSFNYLTASYIDSDAGQASGDGFGAGFGIQLLDFVYATAEFSTRQFDTDSGNTDLQFISAGVGGNYSLFADGRLTVFGAVTWEQLDNDPSGGGSGEMEEEMEESDGTCLPGDPTGFLCLPGGAAAKASAKALSPADRRLDGYGLQVGVRSLVWRALEVGARIRFRDYGDQFDETIFSVSADYGFGGAWSVGVSYDSFDEADLDEIYGTVRYTFGQGGSGSIW